MLLKIRHWLRTYTLPILSGIFVGTTEIPFPPWALLFCLAPLWVFWSRHAKEPMKVFWGGWISQFLVNLIGFHWIAQTAIEYGGFPTVLGYLILLLFACVAHLYYPLAGYLWARWGGGSLWLIPLIFAICESFYPTIFYWHLGYTWFWIGLPGLHLAEWIGFYGLNLITLIINLLFVLFWLHRRKKYLLLAFLIFAVPQVLGIFLKNRFQEGDQTFSALVVQANIGNVMKVEQDKGSRFHEYILRRFSELTASGLEKHPQAQLIIWPETAYPSRITSIGRGDFFQQRLAYSIQTFARPLLTGAYEQEYEDVFNSMVLFDKNGQFIKSYKKTMLLAFGEYFPGSKMFPKLKEWFPMVSDFGRGKGPDVLALNETTLPRLGAQICYESLFDYNTYDLYKKQAQVIVNVTNDSWFGSYFEPYQHLYATLSRAIEFRIPLIRSTNTGISTAISASGEIADLSPLHQEWAGLFTVKYKNQPEPTLYSYYAGAWPWILLFLLFVILGGRFARKS